MNIVDAYVLIYSTVIAACVACGRVDMTCCGSLHV